MLAELFFRITVENNNNNNNNNYAPNDELSEAPNDNFRKYLFGRRFQI